MITPTFNLSQNNDFILLQLTCPYIKSQECSIDINGSILCFNCHPYFLRLEFTAQLIEDGREKSSYALESGILSLELPKAIPGQVFLDLDLITNLMDKKVDLLMKGSVRPSIQILNQEATEEEEMDWTFSTISENQSFVSSYGFNNLYQGYSQHITELARELIDVLDLDQSSPSSRRQNRLDAEQDKFDVDYYMWDYCMNQDLVQALEWKSPFSKALKRVQKNEEQDELVFTPEENEEMARLSNRQCNILWVYHRFN